MPPQSIASQVPIPTSNKDDKSALAGFILGLISIIAWLIPIIGGPIALCAIIFSSIGLKSTRRHGKALTGLVLGIIFLILAIINSIFGAALAVMNNSNSTSQATSTEQETITNNATDTTEMTTSSFDTNIPATTSSISTQKVTPPTQTVATTAEKYLSQAQSISTHVTPVTPVTPSNSSSGNVTLITFDDLSTPDTSGTYMNVGPIADGYKGLNWNSASGNFTVGDSTDAKGPSGYQLGAVSPKNIAFCAIQCVISSTNPSNTFNLISLYATAPWNDGEKVYIGGLDPNGNRLYNNTYTINASRPTLLTLNYYGVSKVVFSADSGTIHPGYNHSASGISVLIDNVTVSF